MAWKGTDKEKLHKTEENDFLRRLDTGIDDMEAGRELMLEEAFQKIRDKVKNRKTDEI